ncbi:MAG: alpha/beta hydrolase [Gammaproteobacteria bacterium]|nr:alpha/beta hydrolase [Gammaproteobacteria bacterium]
MPTPALYTGTEARSLFEEVPTERRKPSIDLLYVTNRAPLVDQKDKLSYGSERSRSVTFGSVKVDLGPGLTWDELEHASRQTERRTPILLDVDDVEELGRYPQTPYLTIYTESGFVHDPIDLASHREAQNTLESEVSHRLNKSSRREVVLYIHGFKTTFEEAAFTIAELCHFLGREHLCAMFTWPAGSRGSLLYSYGRDRESGEASVAHVKQAIRSIAGVPGVEKLHLVAHSRGTDVLLQALRELMLETYVFGESPREALKIENLVLVAADIDTEVMLRYLTLYGSDPDMPTRWQKNELPLHLQGPMTIYVSDSDLALRASAVLFRSGNRLGRVRSSDFTDHIKDFLMESDKVHIIKTPRDQNDLTGHSYFTRHPAVSSDLVALIRYGLHPGDVGRPLRPVKPPFIWAIEPDHEDQR